MAIEAGIDGDSTFSWVVIENASRRGEARSATLPLPAVILQKVREGEALGPVMSRYTGIDEIGRKEGAIGVFTAGKPDSRQRLSPGGDPGAESVS